MKRHLPIQLAISLATSLMGSHAAAGSELNPSQAMELSRKRIIEFWGRQRHKGVDTTNQRKARKAKRRAWAAGDKRAFG